MQLTGRDRELCGLLTVARYLTTEQIRRLVFPGTDESLARKQLARLAGLSRQLPQPYLRRLVFRRWDGRDDVTWGLAPRGVVLGQAVGGAQPNYPDADLSTGQLERLAGLNELFAAIWSRTDGHALTQHRRFQWQPGDLVRAALRAGSLRPQAVLTILDDRARWFIEEAPYAARRRNLVREQGPLMPKVHRYLEYFAFAYPRAFPDGIAPSLVLFATAPYIANAVSQALGASRYRDAAALGRVRVLTLDEAVRAAGVAVRATEPRRRLRAATPSVRGENLGLLGEALREALRELQKQRHHVRSLPEEVRTRWRLTEPAYPTRFKAAVDIIHQVESASAALNSSPRRQRGYRHGDQEG